MAKNILKLGENVKNSPNRNLADIGSVARKFCDGVRKTGIGVVYSPAS
jgi:hypothetical protein